MSERFEFVPPGSLRNCNLSEAAKLTLNKAIQQRRASNASEIKVLV